MCTQIHLKWPQEEQYEIFQTKFGIVSTLKNNL